MPTYIRVKDLPNSASSLNADDYIMLSGSIAGARKIVKNDFLSTVADEFKAAPSTYKLATLDASNKVDSSQWPASAFSYQGTWAASSNTPTLANGTGTAGYTYYASDAGSVNFGAGAISFTAGDAVVYDGSIWQKVPDVANILDGKGTVDEGKTTLQIPDVGTAANEVPVNGMLNSGAYLDFDAFYETGTWSPSITFGNGSTGVLYSEREGYFTRIGDTVFVSGVCTISAVGGSNGTARITGLPFVSRNMASTSFTVSSVAAFDMTGLTSAITALIEDNQPNAILYDGGATGSTAIDHSNFTATSSIRFSATYQIA